MLTCFCSFFRRNPRHRKSLRNYLTSRMMPYFWKLTFIKKLKFNNFVWVSWFLCQNLYNFVHPLRKLHTPYCKSLEPNHTQLNDTNYEQLVRVLDHKEIWGDELHGEVSGRLNSYQHPFHLQEFRSFDIRMLCDFHILW